MNEPSKEDLLGYMLGALDAEEQGRIQRALDDRPDLEQELLSLKSQLMPLELIDRPAGPPPGLARRTCQLIAMATRSLDELPTKRGSAEEASATAAVGSAFDRVMADHVASAEQANRSLGRTSSARLSAEPRHSRQLTRTLSMSDFVVGIVVAGILGSLLFPVILTARHQQRVLQCQQNLGTIYKAFVTFANTHQRDTIPVPTSGPLCVAGVFAPFLKDQGLVDDSSIFFCPGAVGGTPCEIPSCDQIVNTPCAIKRQKFCERMSGDYGFSLGYHRDGQYVEPRVIGEGNAVLVADAPAADTLNHLTRNHDNKGANCLLQNGEIVFVSSGVYGGDSIYTNDLGIVSAGLHHRDSVIANGHTPFPNVRAAVQ